MDALYSWIGFIMFWGAVVIGLIAIILAIVTVCGWHVAGHKVLTDEDYDLMSDRLGRLYEVRRWFAPFTELDLIWDYIIDGNDDVSIVRNLFAAKRGVTVYNQPTPFADAMKMGEPQCPNAHLYTCTRIEGHEGPCAAIPSMED